VGENSFVCFDEAKTPACPCTTAGGPACRQVGKAENVLFLGPPGEERLIYLLPWVLRLVRKGKECFLPMPMNLLSNLWLLE